MTPKPAGVLPAQLPRAVVFDMDGLMLDSERWERTAWQAAENGVPNSSGLTPSPETGQTLPP